MKAVKIWVRQMKELRKLLLFIEEESAAFCVPARTNRTLKRK